MWIFQTFVATSAMALEDKVNEYLDSIPNLEYDDMAVFSVGEDRSARFVIGVWFYLDDDEEKDAKKEMGFNSKKPE